MPTELVVIRPWHDPDWKPAKPAKRKYRPYKYKPTYRKGASVTRYFQKVWPLNGTRTRFLPEHLREIFEENLRSAKLRSFDEDLAFIETQMQQKMLNLGKADIAGVKGLEKAFAKSTAIRSGMQKEEAWKNLFLWVCELECMLEDILAASNSELSIMEYMELRSKIISADSKKSQVEKTHAGASVISTFFMTLAAAMNKKAMEMMNPEAADRFLREVGHEFKREIARSNLPGIDGGAGGGDKPPLDA